MDSLWCLESDLLDSKSENISYIENVKQWDLTDIANATEPEEQMNNYNIMS